MMNIIEKKYFFKVDEYFENMKKNDMKIRRLLRLLESMGNIILVGGSIRDILINNEIPRDIDFILDTNKDIGLILNKYKNCKKNRFGGYKLNINSVEFDIWRISDHWAFKENILENQKSNLKNSTFLNFDSLFYNITLKKIIDIDLFNRCMNEKILDITLKDEYIEYNPSKDINVLRMLIIMNKWKLKLSNRSRKYILGWLKENQNSFQDKLYKAQIKHYKRQLMDEFTMNKILKRVYWNNR